MQIPDRIYEPLRDLIATGTGLHFGKRRDLEAALSRAAQKLGFDNVSECANWLLSASQGTQSISMLAEHLTVGETYFFRDAKLFGVLEKKVLPEFAFTGRTVRIWSAGCCTGEEAYSLAILTDRMGISSEILASDINGGFLEKAKMGHYGEWSFRDCPAWVREGYFEKRNNGYRIDARIAQKVNFFRHNLAADPFPAGMDIVFCRNVMMYFGEKMVRRLAENLKLAVVEGGILVVSPVEAADDYFKGFQRVEIDGAVFYEKKAPEPVLFSFWNQEMGEFSGMANVQEKTPDPAEMARIFADKGELGEAEKWCRRALDEDGMDFTVHYLLSRILHEKREFVLEEEELGKVLYLAPDFIPAHVALGNLKKSAGRNPDASFSRALSLLSLLSRDDILPDSGGISAGRLAEMVRIARGG